MQITVKSCMYPSLLLAGLFCSVKELFCSDIELFCSDKELFCSDIELFCSDMGLFPGTCRSLSSTVWEPSGRRSLPFISASNALTMKLIVSSNATTTWNAMEGSGFRSHQGFGFRVQALGFRVPGSEFRIRVVVFRV